jgi:hypothetical protein
MYEFHGWVTIHETTAEIDAGNLEGIIGNIQGYISKLSWSSGLLKLYPANGMYHLAVGGCLNRKTSEAEDLLQLYRFIAEQAPGSYGLLYTWDDEDIEGYDNEFRVYVLARGNLQLKKDIYLSPCVPVVEDNE